MSSATAFCSPRVQSFACPSRPWRAPPGRSRNPRRYRCRNRSVPQVPPAVPFTNTPVTVLNWFLIADETQGPAIITTRTIIAMTRTYSMAPWPRRRVFLGDTHPPKVNCRRMHMRHSLRMGIDIACRAYVKANRLARNVPLRQRRHGCPRHINCLPFCFFRPTATPSGG